MADDVVSELDTHWIPATCTKGVINYTNIHPINMVGYGVVFDYAIPGYKPESINAPYGTDYYVTYIVGISNADINALIGHLIYLFDDALGTFYTGNATYSRFYLNVENIKMLDKIGDLRTNSTWKVAMCETWCVKLYHDKNRLFVQPYVAEFGGKR